MVFGKRRPRSADGPCGGGLRPVYECLEGRVVPAAIDLTNVASAPYGVQQVGSIQTLGAGFSVADVGDTNGDGFDDFVIGAPSVTAGTTSTGANTFLTNNVSTVSRTYLVLGSATVQGPSSFLSLIQQQRIGDLGQLDNIGQTSPINGSPTGYDYAGITFLTGQNPSAQLGASVAAAGDVNGDGFADFLIGAPGAFDVNGANAGTGRAYLVFGGPNLGQSAVNTPVDLDNLVNPSTGQGNYPDLNGVVTFVNTTTTATTNTIPNARIGQAVAGIGTVFGGTRPAIAIGAPNATVNGLANSGAIYVIPGTTLAGQVRNYNTIPLQSVGQTGGVSGLIFAGAASGDESGAAIAAAGNFDGDLASGRPLNDFLIGAPDVNSLGTVTGPGSAYLIYGASLATLSGFAVSNNGLLSIPLSTVGSTATGAVPGVVFNGANTGDQVGFSVAPAGNFDNDADTSGNALDDILIGSPGVNGSAGLATVIYGQPNANRLIGSFTITNLPASVPATSFQGVSSNDLAGFSVSSTADINQDGINEILIGSPGINGGSGSVFLIPGNTGLRNLSIQLSQTTIQDTTVAGTVITVSNSTRPAFLGSSVSGRLTLTNQGLTIDPDTRGDFIIGAPAYTLNNTTTLVGTAFALEGALVPLDVPVVPTLSVSIAVSSVIPPFTINAANSSLVTFVFSNATTSPTFNPVTDIDPTTITANGVAFPTASLANVGDLNGDGIPDASITITPVSSLNLSNGAQTFTLAGQTLATSPFGIERFVGTANVTVVNASGGGTGGNGAVVFPIEVGTTPNIGFTVNSGVVPQYGERLVPPTPWLQRLWWKPIPLHTAYKQFYPERNFAFRFHNFYHPGGVHSNASFSSGKAHGARNTATLGYRVFDRGRTSTDKPVTLTKPSYPTVPAIPYAATATPTGVTQATASHQVRLSTGGAYYAPLITRTRRTT